MVVVRDAKDRDGPRLSFDVAAWGRFCEEIRQGALDRG
jgi:hypothetical protein